MYEATILIASAVILLLFNFQFRNPIIQRWPESKHPVFLMSFAVGSAIILAASVLAVIAGNTPIATFFVVLSLLLGYFIYYGIKHRKEVSKKMRLTYVQLVVSYSYVFATLGLLMFVAAPFFPNVTL